MNSQQTTSSLSAQEIEQQIRQKLQQNPQDPFMTMEMANVLLQTKRMPEARDTLNRALVLLSSHYEQKMQQPTEQIMNEFKGYLAKIYAMMGSSWHWEVAYPQAAELYQKSLGIVFSLDVALDLSICYERMEMWEEAAAKLKEIIDKDPDSYNAWIRYYHLLRQMCNWDNFAFNDESFKKALLQRERNLAIMVGAQSLYEMDDAKVLDVAKFISGAIKKRVSFFYEQKKYTFDRPDKPKIRIGYISADIQNHATAHLMFGLWGKHNRDEFEIYTYCYSNPDDSFYRKRIMEDSDQFLSVLGLSDNQIADRIYEDQIDILVDLKGYTHNHKMDVLAMRPAPVVVTYLGFPGTTGADFIDYAIVDEIVAPPESAMHYTEELAYMPDCYQVNSDEQPIAPQKPSRAEAGLPEDAIVYASFNNPYKLSPDVFDRWLNILEAVPKAVLWLYAPKDITQKNLKAYADKKGLADRVYFAPHASKPEHLARLQQADIFLDTLPCNAHTTASDALWAGVPVLTCKGTHFASRVAASLLTNIGLPELITESLDDYEKLATELGNNPSQIADLKKKLEANKKTEPLFDTTKFATNIEALYKKMWENYKKGELPKQISL